MVNISLGFYNTFTMMNISTTSPLPEDQISQLMRLVGQPSRILILLAMGEREVCVCHLEAALDQRQAFISQHLKQLRKAGFVIAERRSRHIYYRLANPGLMDIIQTAARLTGNMDWFDAAQNSGPLPNCSCPECSGINASC
ncbi:MAG: metalloregulator ArsR/SmtB family transcription factor [Anaerolineaceae bacterium]